MHYGDPIEELVEEELAELGWKGKIPTIRHFRDDAKLYTFENELPAVACADAELAAKFQPVAAVAPPLRPGTATVVVAHPETGTQFRLAVRYLRTEDSGPLFECMRAKLAGIASHTGMSGVFKLRGADIYRVLGIRKVTAAREGSATVEFDAVVRIDTPGEADYYRHGGILQYVLRSLVAAEIGRASCRERVCLYV